MFQQDYILRIIHETIRMALKLLCGVDVDAPESEPLETREERDALKRLTDLMDRGEIDRAENLLFDGLTANDPSSLKTALLFYEHLNRMDDAFLEAHDFSREEVRTGLRDALSRWGAPELGSLLAPETERSGS